MQFVHTLFEPLLRDAHITNTQRAEGIELEPLRSDAHRDAASRDETASTAPAGASAFCFKRKRAFDDRRAMTRALALRYPNRVALVAERAALCTHMPIAARCKFLGPEDLTVARFLFELRRVLNLPPAVSTTVTATGALYTDQSDHAMVRYFDRSARAWLTPPLHCMLGTLHRAHHDADGFLYLWYYCRACNDTWHRHAAHLIEP